MKFPLSWKLEVSMFYVPHATLEANSRILLPVASAGTTPFFQTKTISG